MREATGGGREVGGGGVSALAVHVIVVVVGDTGVAGGGAGAVDAGNRSGAVVSDLVEHPRFRAFPSHGLVGPGTPCVCSISA